ncbi:MAG TPA: hypothetical protein VKV05_10885 [Terriglobales bacterium]|nr:hypothetical protein [Terriglobales bacterium]
MFRPVADSLDRNQQPVATLGDGADVVGLVAGIDQRMAQFLYCSVDAVVELDHRFVGPEPPSNLLAGNNLAVGLDQHAQNLQGLIGKDKAGNVVLAQFSRPKINFEGAKPHAIGQNFFHGNGLGKVWHSLQRIGVPLGHFFLNPSGPSYSIT